MNCPHPAFELGVPIWESELSEHTNPGPPISGCEGLRSEGQQEVI